MSAGRAGGCPGFLERREPGVFLRRRAAERLLGTSGLRLRPGATFNPEPHSKLDSAELVGEQEHRAGQVELQRGFFMVTSEDSPFPDEQIGVEATEFVPVINARACRERAMRSRMRKQYRRSWWS